ncbi:MAG: HPr family phosphocarrier protein [Lachnospiraceae bacterium]|nr:HPr family phosphocarrier protein [Lachnospiraceae bacterium]
MKEFSFAVTDPLGIHARPAGLLAKLCKGFEGTTVTVVKGDKEAKASQLMKLMSLAVKSGDTVTVKVEGPAENEAFAALEAFFKENL